MIVPLLMLAGVLWVVMSPKKPCCSECASGEKEKSMYA